MSALLPAIAHDRLLVDLLAGHSATLARSRSTTTRWLVRTTSSSSEEMKTHALPSSASSSTSFWISALAPTSMPAGGLVEDQQPRLGRQPAGQQHLLLVAAAEVLDQLVWLGVLMGSALMKRSAISPAAGRGSRRQPRLACRARTMFSRTDRWATMPSALRSSGA